MEDTLLDGRYEVGCLLGGGGMGKVFLARDTVLDRDVALKVLREPYAESEEFVERFEREAKAAASLNYPNIVAVYDRGRTEDGTYFIAMEHVPCGTLKDRILREGFLAPAEAARLAAQVAEALGVAHERGIVHRDVKPQNILLDASGDAKVADFGIARAASAAPISNSSLVLGTAKYMSPEQAMGGAVGPAGDLYSLGVVLYEMLTGEVPFDADSSVGVAMKHVMEPPRPPKEANPRVPDTLNAVVMKLLEKKPEDRYPGAAELVADLRRAGEGLSPVFAAPPAASGSALGPASEAETTRRLAAPAVAPVSGGRRPRLLAAALVALLAVLGLAGLLGLSSRGYDGPVVGTLGKAAEEARRYLGVGEGEVPKVVGLTEEEARGLLAEEGFGVSVVRRGSAEEDEGKVLEQSVAAGREADRGSRIAIAVGDGPRTVKSPDLVGLTPDKAEKESEESEEAGLKTGAREGAPSEGPRGRGGRAGGPHVGSPRRRLRWRSGPVVLFLVGHRLTEPVSRCPGTVGVVGAPVLAGATLAGHRLPRRVRLPGTSFGGPPLGAGSISRPSGRPLLDPRRPAAFVLRASRLRTRGALAGARLVPAPCLVSAGRGLPRTPLHAAPSGSGHLPAGALLAGADAVFRGTGLAPPVRRAFLPQRGAFFFYPVFLRAAFRRRRRLRGP